MAFNLIRDYFSDRTSRIIFEWQKFQKNQSSPEATLNYMTETDIQRHFQHARNIEAERHQAQILQSEFDRLVQSLKLKNLENNEPFQFTEDILNFTLPDNRIPAPGILPIPKKFHSGRIVSPTDDLPESGFPIHPLLQYLIKNKYPRYQEYADKYVRPLGTTDATFSDFNREQKPTAPIPEERKERILSHIFERLNAKPYLPMHFVDTQYAKVPLNTGTGYHNRHHFKTRAHAKYSRPEQYAHLPTSKGYFLNAFLEQARTLIHNIKMTGLPFNFDFSDSKSDEENFSLLAQYLNTFIDNHGTMLFTRNHISDRDGNLKQRPVYACDDLFILIELMLTFPLLVMARKPESCIMYGLETIRGAMHYIDAIAQTYHSFFTIDWSQYDQRLPRPITDLYYTDFLERLIIISHGYQPTYEYPTYPDLTDENLFTRMTNLLSFLHLWYNNMTFITADGYGYRRLFCGVPSGLYNTQYLDSFGNLFLIIDGLIEYGCTDEEIRSFILFIMGDDNSGMTLWSLARLEAFISFFETYALEQYNMVLSKTKSVITMLRNKIELLSYSCNFGSPRRPLGKLVAQLIYPERGPKDKFMSYRAIGIAFAAAAMDNTFHNFCKDVYNMFLPFAAPLDAETRRQIAPYLPGYLKVFEDYDEFMTLERFPTIHDVRYVYSWYHGPLGYAPKWNYAHFIHDPDHIPDLGKPVVTIALYRKLHNIPRKPVPVPPIGQSLPI
jgi:hypothetical protein